MDELVASRPAQEPVTISISIIRGSANDVPARIDEGESALLRSAVRRTFVSSEPIDVDLGYVTLCLQALSGRGTAQKAGQIHAPNEKQQSTAGVSGSLVEQFNHYIARRINELPPEYLVRRQALADLETASRKTIAEALEAVLNEYVATQPQATYEEKKELAKWINRELRDFHLAIRCPKTGLPATLVGHPGGDPGTGRFQLEVSEAGKRPRRTVSSVTLPRLDLLPETPDRTSRPDRGRAR